MSSTSSSCRTGPPQAGQRSRSVRLTLVRPQPRRLAVPHRDAVAPPELAGDAPVADALQPVGVVVAPALGDELEGAVAVPLPARAGRAAPSARTTDRTAAARPPCRSGSSGPPRAGAARPCSSSPAASNSATTRRARLEAVEPLEPLRRGQADPRLGRHDVDAGQVVPAADLEVGRVVRRRDLHRAGAERGIHGVVGDDGDQPVHERQPELAADQVRGSARPRDAPPRRCRPASSRGGWWPRSRWPLPSASG